MSSAAQALANKSNAARSTGPKSQAGKANSRLNAWRHGLTAATVVMPHESRQAYQTFASGLLADLAPHGIAEQQLAQTIVDSKWRLNRVFALETNLLSLAQLEPPPPHLAGVTDPATRAALLEAAALVKYERQLRNLHLQEQRLLRLVRNTSDQLTALQCARRAHENRQAKANQSRIGFDFLNPKSAPAHNLFPLVPPTPAPQKTAKPEPKPRRANPTEPKPLTQHAQSAL